MIYRGEVLTEGEYIWEHGGTGIYQSDAGQDIKESYMSYLRAGKSDEEALAGILDMYEAALEDDDECYDVAFAPADTMWKKGRLTEEIRQMALKLIKEKEKSGRWEGGKLISQRQGVLTKLEKQLNFPMPERKRVPVHKPYRMGWKPSDVFTFPLEREVEKFEEYKGWYGGVYVDSSYLEDWQVKGIYDEILIIYVFVSP